MDSKYEDLEGTYSTKYELYEKMKDIGCSNFKLNDDDNTITEDDYYQQSHYGYFRYVK